MTVGEIMDLEEKAGRRLSQQEISDIETSQKKEIKKFINYIQYSDVDPYEVIKKVSDICVEVREMKTVQTKFPKTVIPGGFAGHTVDNRDGQDYTYSSNEDAPIQRVRWSKAKRSWFNKSGGRFSMSDTPYKFYDYNF